MVTAGLKQNHRTLALGVMVDEMCRLVVYALPARSLCCCFLNLRYALIRDDVFGLGAWCLLLCLVLGVFCFLVLNMILSWRVICCWCGRCGGKLQDDVLSVER
jgi:hypothetical protein